MDYWDRLGWKDPFGSKQMTEAQKAYEKPLASKGMYTPMIVVSGAIHTSNMGQAVKRIDDDGKATAAATITASGKVRAVNAFVEARVTLPPDVKQAVEVTVAVAENNLTTEIKAGELKGHTVTEHGVVRFLSRPSTPDKDGNTGFDIPLGGDWKTANVYLAIVARDPATRKVLGAKRLEWKDLAAVK